MTQILAIDPDLHSTGWALGDNASDPFAISNVGVVRIPSALTGDDAVVAMCRQIKRELSGFHPETLIVVEGQQIYRGKTPNPMSILNLGQVAGACLTLPAHGSAVFTRPTEWKGNVPKHICQGRALSHFGILKLFVKMGGKDPYYGSRKDAKAKLGVLFRGAEKLNSSDWKHVGDAVALLLWAARRRGLAPKKR